MQLPAPIFIGMASNPFARFPFNEPRKLYAEPRPYGHEGGYATLDDALTALRDVTAGEANPAAAVLLADGRFYGHRIEALGSRLTPPWMGPGGGQMVPHREPFHAEGGAPPQFEFGDAALQAVIDGATIISRQQA